MPLVIEEWFYQQKTPSSFQGVRSSAAFPCNEQDATLPNDAWLIPHTLWPLTTSPRQSNPHIIHPLPSPHRTLTDPPTPSKKAPLIPQPGRRSTLPLYASHILARHGIPRGHVLLHAHGKARLFFAAEREARCGDAFFEAVFVEFLLRCR